MNQETLYDRLGLPKDATPEEIRRAYRDLARRLHPDRNVNPGETELFIGVQEAYEILSDQRKREEYDKSLPQKPSVPPPLLSTVQYSRNSLIQMVEPQLIYVLIEFSPSPQAQFDPPPLNVCLVLDCSTSMQGARLDTVKATAIELVRQLRPQDIFSVVQFSDRAEVLIPAGAHIERKGIETRIQLLQASGGTEIYQGLEAGLSEVRRYRNSQHVNHIILITDGRTYGDETICLELGEQASVLGIGISALGIGSQWNDRFLDQLCSRAGGSSKYVSRAEDIRQYLSDKIAGLGRSFAENLTYHIEIPDGVELSYAFRLNPDASPVELLTPLILGSVPRDTNYTWLAEFTVKGISPETTEVILASGRLSYNVPGSKTLEKFNQRLVLTRPISQKLDAEPPPPTVVQAMARLTLYRMQERARQDLERGNIREATRRLQNLATHLLAQGQRELARTVLNEVAHIQQHQTFSEGGDKQIKYGTRSLLLPPGTKEKKP